MSLRGAGQVIDATGVTFDSGDGRFYRLAALCRSSGGGTITVYDNTAASGTVIASAKADEANDYVEIIMPQGAYYDIGLHIAASAGDTFELVALFYTPEGNRTGAIA